MKNFWHYWCKALGAKAFEDDDKADRVAMIRTVWILLNAVTCLFIIAGNLKTLGII